VRKRARRCENKEGEINTRGREKREQNEGNEGERQEWVREVWGVRGGGDKEGGMGWW